MSIKREAINVLVSPIVNQGLQTLATNLGISKSRAVRLACVDYLKREQLLTETNAEMFQHL